MVTDNTRSLSNLVNWLQWAKNVVSVVATQPIELAANTVLVETAYGTVDTVTGELTDKLNVWRDAHKRAPDVTIVIRDLSIEYLVTLESAHIVGA